MNVGSPSPMCQRRRLCRDCHDVLFHAEYAHITDYCHNANQSMVITPPKQSVTNRNGIRNTSLPIREDSKSVTFVPSREREKGKDLFEV